MVQRVRDRPLGEQHGRALFCFFRISPGSQAVGVRESERKNRARKKKKLC